ncbi:D-alanine--D-alanine ligase [bacterium]|nr:D-alanine--D-alanine ligase [bacterium]
MDKKIRVGILFGGLSAEHEVSLQSAQNVIDAIDKQKYEVIPIGITKKGKWLMGNESELLLNSNDPKLIALNQVNEEISLVPSCHGQLSNNPGAVDVVFPILHGPMGEDGTVQGLLELACVPYVGAGVLGSAVGMDKDVMKRLLRDAGIPTADFLVYRSVDDVDGLEVEAKLGWPVFVKPVNMGSSVGVNKASNESELYEVVKEAFSYDTKIIVEEAVEGREIECAVLGNRDPVASIPGEIVPAHDFYSYEAKYIDENGAALKIPAELDAEKVEEVQGLAVRVFKLLECSGLGRVDFFLQPDGELKVIEINTIPGFTKVSMYPQLWEHSGIPYTELIDRLIKLAIERFESEQSLRTHLFWAGDPTGNDPDGH